MLLTDLNAPGGIGANCLLLQLDGLNIVIDAGLHPRLTGRAALPRLERLQGLSVDLVFLTHCHLDHVGALPVLLREHPEALLVMTRDTACLYQVMLRNSRTVMERQRAELGVAEYPLFSYRDIAACGRRTIEVVPGHSRHFESARGERLTFTLYASGHIPGAAGILLEHRHRRIFHTGDVLFADTALLDGARFPGGDMDTVIVETTRGATHRSAPRESEMERLLGCIRDTTAHGGSVLIPAFALGRMQELIAVLHAARRDGRLGPLPLYLSGLGIELLNQFDGIARRGGHLRARRKMLRELRAEKLPLHHSPERARPGVYLLSSGMMVESTPSYETAAALLGSARNAICFVGYCDPDTPGGQLRDARHNGQFLFSALGRSVPVRARIEKFDLSSHADREDLLAYTLGRHPRAVVLTHGDPPARAWFRARIGEADPRCHVVDPVPLETVPV